MSFFGAVALRPLFKVTVTEDIDEWMLPDCSAKSWLSENSDLKLCNKLLVGATSRGQQPGLLAGPDRGIPFLMYAFALFGLSVKITVLLNSVA